MRNNLAPHWDSIPGRPGSSESVHELRHAGPLPAKVGEKIRLRCIFLYTLFFACDWSSSNLVVLLPKHFHTVCAISEAFIILRNEIFRSILKSGSFMVSHLFPSGNYLQIWGRQDSAWLLETQRLADEFRFKHCDCRAFSCEVWAKWMYIPSYTGKYACWSETWRNVCVPSTLTGIDRYVLVSCHNFCRTSCNLNELSLRLVFLATY
jgi:hypothetical protein